ncbi:MAG: DNA repair protein RecO [Bacteroidales bacterium]|nr:DNA repair protein RecO [Bacteroidales bacterium]
MHEQTRAIVIRYLKYTDHSAIAHLYTEKFGRISVMVRHSKSKKSVSKKSILQPLFLLNINIVYKHNREIQQCSEMNNFPFFNDIPFNIVKNSIALFLAEILSKVLKEEEANPALFEFLHSSLQLFDQSKEGAANFHLIFLYELSKFLGFYPDNNYSIRNKYFSLRDGYYTDFQRSDEISLNEQLSEQFYNISNKGFGSLHTLSLARELRIKILLALIKYYQFHLPEIGKIKSLDVLNQLFDT